MNQFSYQISYSFSKGSPGNYQVICSHKCYARRENRNAYEGLLSHGEERSILECQSLSELKSKPLRSDSDPKFLRRAPSDPIPTGIRRHIKIGVKIQNLKVSEMNPIKYKIRLGSGSENSESSNRNGPFILKKLRPGEHEAEM